VIFAIFREKELFLELRWILFSALPEFAISCWRESPRTFAFTRYDLLFVLFCDLFQVLCLQTLREANDRGYEGLVLEDCTASLEDSVYRAAIRSIHLSGGIFGATCHSQELLSKLEKFQ
jgi:hypothetical protein